MTDRNRENYILNSIKLELENTKNLYSKKGKKKRERISLEEFLSLLKIPFKLEEFDFPPENCPSRSDIKFRHANFQIKNVPDDNCKITEESRDVYNRNKNITELQDLNLLYPIKSFDGYKSVLEIIVDEINRLENKVKKPKYSISEKKEIDLLIYITRTKAVGMIDEVIPLNLIKFFKEAGYRSISFVFCDKQAMIVHSNTDAPDFIWQRKGLLFAEQ